MPEEASQIVPVEQKTIDFYGDDLVAVRDETGTVWVPVALLCEALGVSRTGQIERIQRDPVLSEALKGCRVTRHPGGPQEMSCLPLKYIRGWLFGINANRVKPEIRDKLVAYQRDVIEIIDRAFARAPLKPAAIDEAHLVGMRDLASQQAKLWDELIRERQRLDAVQPLAEEPEGMIGDQYQEIATLQRQIDELRGRQLALEAELTRRLTAFSDQIHLLPSPRETAITPDQKAAIKALVDDIVAAAQAKGIRLGQGRNDYPAVWDAFKRRFDLAKYDELTASQYDEALAWLKNWLDRIREG